VRPGSSSSPAPSISGPDRAPSPGALHLRPQIELLPAPSISALRRLPPSPAPDRAPPRRLVRSSRCAFLLPSAALPLLSPAVRRSTGRRETRRCPSPPSSAPSPAAELLGSGGEAARHQRQGRCRGKQRKACPAATAVEAGGAETASWLCLRCWRREIFASPTRTVHTRQYSVCLSFLPLIVGVSLGYSALRSVTLQITSLDYCIIICSMSIMNFAIYQPSI